MAAFSCLRSSSMSVAPRAHTVSKKGLPSLRLSRRSSVFRANAVAAPVAPPSSGASGDDAFAVSSIATPLTLPQEYWATQEPATSALPAWRQNLDLEAFGKDMFELENKLKKEQSQDDVDHLKGVLRFSQFLYAAGIVLAGFCNPLQGNILAAVCLSTAVCARWTMVGHHVCHGGYNRLQKPTERFHRKSFALGPVRRVIDWLDWMAPEAWDVEHNDLHHYKLGETTDPDLLERNTIDMRAGSFGPKPFRYLIVGALMAVWKWYYYAPNTLKELYQRSIDRAAAGRPADRNATGEVPKVNPFNTGDEPATVLYLMKRLFMPGSFAERVAPTVALAKCCLPYFMANFVAVPLAFYAALGPAAGKLALMNMVAMELITNIHSFIIIATNHCGEDVYRFATPCRPRSPDFYLRAVIGSVNFDTGAKTNPDGSHKSSGLTGNAVDYVQGWLNYQIEHHAFPTLSMLAYQKGAPQVKAICEKHGVPYVQENVFIRVKKTVDIMVGNKSMKQWERGD